MSDPPTTTSNGDANAVADQHAVRSGATWLFVGFLGFVAGLYLVVVIYSVTMPPQSDATQSPAFLERCRRVCDDYGLVPTGRVDQDARQFLEATDHERVAGTLNEAIADAVVAESQEHPLLNQPAPQFALSSVQSGTVSLAELNREGPVVLVFYYGYFCSHCVAQLFALNDDLKYFEELGATVVAVSADRPQETAEKYAEYGEFDFRVLSDPENRVAQSYGVYRPQTESEDEDLLHGTFVIDRQGRVVWAYSGHLPFTDNQSLLRTIADD